MTGLINFDLKIIINYNTIKYGHMWILMSFGKDLKISLNIIKFYETDY